MSKPSLFTADQLATMSLDELERAVRYHNQRYWDQAQPEISDYDYDQLVLQLKKINPDSPALEEMGPSAAPDPGTAVRHLTPMLSLDKCYTDEELQSWAAKFEGEVVVTPKMDGIAATLRYDDRGRLMLAATRGSGIEGDDITVNARTIRDIPGRAAAGAAGGAGRDLHAAERLLRLLRSVLQPPQPHGRRDQAQGPGAVPGVQALLRRL